MLDMIRFRFSSGGLALDGLRDEWEFAGFDICRGKLNGRCVEFVRRGSNAIRLFTRQAGRTAYQLEINPARFQSYLDCLQFLREVIPLRYLRTGSLSELHLSVDYPIPLSDVIEGIQLPKKRKTTEYYDGARRTGVMIGANHECLLVYDKFAEQKLKKKDKCSVSDPTTRIELRLRGRKLPTRDLLSLEATLRRTYELKQSLWPMSAVSLHSVQLRTVSGLKLRERLYQERFASHVRLMGFQLARKFLGRGCNFRQRYERYFELHPFAMQPSRRLCLSLASFFDWEIGCLSFDDPGDFVRS